MSVFSPRDWGIRGALNRLQSLGSYGSKRPLADWPDFPPTSNWSDLLKNSAPSSFAKSSITKSSGRYLFAR